LLAKTGQLDEAEVWVISQQKKAPTKDLCRCFLYQNGHHFTKIRQIKRLPIK
jgi:hypothetical protein